jgi:hypothetical protein
MRANIVVIGDEVESILTAVSAARQGAQVILVRSSQGPLGGLSVRGGLSYMDITPDFVCGIFAEFLARAGVIRVALNPDTADRVLREMLSESGITVYSGCQIRARAPQNLTITTRDGQAHECRTKILIDSTPDADIARQLGVPYIIGLGGLLGAERNFLGVSPVFRITGVSVEALQEFEVSLRMDPALPECLKQALPYHPETLRAEYLTRPTFAPPDMDYLDILNPVIGIDYHIWRHGFAATYPEAAIAIDGGNISRLADGSLGFNGMVATAQGLGLDFESLLALSQGDATPNVLLQELTFFQQYLRERTNLKNASVIAPQSVYVRQTLTLISHRNLSAKRMLAGGASPEESLGAFSYWLDLRGIPFWRAFPDELEVPKPVFNIDPGVAYSDLLGLDNFAFVSRSAGYSPIGQGAGRIVQHNALLGEGIGVAAALAVQSGVSLKEQLQRHLPVVQGVLAERRQQNICLPTGQCLLEEPLLSQSRLLVRDEEIVEKHRH